MRAFPTFTNANEHVLLPLDSDCMGRDDAEYKPGWGSVRVFICVKPDETNVQRMLYSLLQVHSSMLAKSLSALLKIGCSGYTTWCKLSVELWCKCYQGCKLPNVSIC